MMKFPVICLGAGGHAGMLVEILEDNPRYELVGLLDQDVTLHGHAVQSVRILGSDELLGSLKRDGVSHFIIGIGATKSCALRKRVYDAAIAVGMQPISVIHPSACIMKTAIISDGVVIMPRAIVNRNVKLGCNVIINSGAVVEHDSMVGDHSHIATAACIAGGVSIGQQVMLGANSTIRENIIVRDNAVVGAGSVVVANVNSSCIVVGSPARALVGNDV